MNQKKLFNDVSLSGYWEPEEKGAKGDRFSRIAHVLSLSEGGTWREYLYYENDVPMYTDPGEAARAAIRDSGATLKGSR